MNVRCTVCALLMVVGGVHSAGAGVLDYEGFDYLDTSTPIALENLNGGTGFSGGWFARGTNPISAFTVAEGSLTSPAFPFTPIGDRTVATGPGTGSNNNRATRAMANTFDLGADGALYVSFLMNKAVNGGDASDNQELDIISGSSLTVRMGSTSGDRFWLGTSTNNFEDVVLGQTYFLVAKIVSSAGSDDVASLLVYAPSETVPVVEPETWDATYSFNSTAVLDSIELWMGTVSSGAFDEIRVGQSWTDVAAVPEPSAAALGLCGAMLLIAMCKRRTCGREE